MTTTTTPITKTYVTRTGTFGDTDWELWQHPDAPTMWGYSLTWGTVDNPGEYEGTEFFANPHEAREAAFVRIARHEAGEVALGDQCTPPDPEPQPIRSFAVINVGGGFVEGARTEFQVHAHGCRDVARLERTFGVNPAWRVDAPTAEDVVNGEVEEYDEQDQGWSHDDHQIMPCCENAPIVG